MKTALRFGWILLCLVLGLAARCWNVRDVFVEGKIYFIDADCYSRMTRVRMIDEGGGLFIRHHDFENWPQGITAHTTAPMDWLIVGLKKVLAGVVPMIPGIKASVLADQPLDLAGALVSPLLGLAGMLILAWWLWKLRVRFGGIALLFYAICPVLVHGTLLGRPDHQSLLIFLFTVALGSELALAVSHLQTGERTSFFSRRGWSVVNALAWAVSFWVSLYEPLVLLGLITLLWMIFGGRSSIGLPEGRGAVAGNSQVLTPLASLIRDLRFHRVRIFIFLAVVILTLVAEGWRISVPDAALREHFGRWQHTIGELSHLDLRSPLLYAWLGWTALAAPVLLFLVRRQDHRALPLLFLLLAVLALTIWQVRWGYFLAVVFAWSLPWQMQVLRRAWVAWPVFLVGLWPVLQDWDQRLAAEDGSVQITMQRAETAALRELVTSTLRGPGGGAFLAPWWLSPSIAYWTGQPGVAGSSHESLPGIVDTAHFYLSTKPEEAATILRARQVRWVLADEPSREINTSATLLGVTPPKETLANTLAERPDDAPAFLAEWKGRPRADGLRFYRLYEVLDAAMLPP